MRTKLLLAACLLAPVASAAGTTAGNGLGRPDDGLCIWILFDTSPSIRSVSGELRTVADAAVEALVPGDRLRLISAHQDRPRLRVLERIGPDGPSEAELHRVLEEVRPAIILKADLAEALAVPLRAARERPALAERTAVLILTDGNLDDGRVADLLEAVDRLESAGACVLCTGTDRSARGLLAAAARGRLRWAGLAEADPAAWISGLRPSPPRPETPGPDHQDGDEEETPKAQSAPAAEPNDSDEQAPAGGSESAVPEGKGPASSGIKEETPSPTPHESCQPAPSLPEPVLKPSPASEGPPQPSAVEEPDSALEPGQDGPPPSPAEEEMSEPGEVSGPAPAVPQSTDTHPDSPPEAAGTQPDVPPKPAARLPEQTAPPGQPPARQDTGGETPVAGEKRLKPAAPELSDEAAPGPDVPAEEREPEENAPADSPAGPSPEERPGGSGESAPDALHTSEPTDGGRDKQARSIGGDEAREAEQPGPVEENEPCRPARPVRLTPSEPTEGAAPAPARSLSPARKTPQPPQEGSWGILLAIGLIPASGLLIWMGVLVVDFVRSRPGKTDSTDTDDEEEPDRRELIAYAGGRKIALGPLAEVRRLDIGSGPRAAVPLTAEGVLPRHATLIRKGEDFRLRNRSRASLTVNGVTLPARRSARIVLPADVLFDGGTRVAFRLQMNPPEGPQPAVQGQS